MSEWGDIEDLELFYFEAKNRADADLWETILINKYAPPKNVSKKVSSTTVPGEDLPEPQNWQRAVITENPFKVRTKLKDIYRRAGGVIISRWWYEIIGEKKDKLVLRQSVEGKRSPDWTYLMKTQNTLLLTLEEEKQLLGWIAQDRVPILVETDIGEEHSQFKKEIRSIACYAGDEHDVFFDPHTKRQYLIMFEEDKEVKAGMSEPLSVEDFLNITERIVS